MRSSRRLLLASCSVLALSACASNEAAPVQDREYVWRDTPGWKPPRKHGSDAPKAKQEPLARAIELHRAGKYPEAIALYEQIFAGREEQRPRGLVADAYLRANRIEDALQAWFGSADASASNSNDRSACEASSAPSAAQRRSALRERIERGELQLAGALLALDLSWVDCGRAQGTNEFLLTKDLEWLDHLPKLSDTERKDLHLYVDFARKAHTLDIEKTLTQAKLIVGDGARLPEDSRVANVLITRLLAARPQLRADLLARHGAELRKRAEERSDIEATRTWLRLSFDGNGDPLPRLTKDLQAHGLDASSRVRDEASALQSFLHDVADPLAEAPPALLKEAWLRHADPGFAYLYLHAQLDAERLTSTSPELVQAVTQFPDDAKIAVLAYALANAEKKPVRERLIAAIKADLRHGSEPLALELRAMFVALHQEVLGKRPSGRARAASEMTSVHVEDRLASAIVKNFTWRDPVFLGEVTVDDVQHYRVEVDLTTPGSSLAPARVVGPLEASELKPSATQAASNKARDKWLVRSQRELAASMPDDQKTSFHFTSDDLSWVVACPGPGAQPAARGLGFKRPSTQAVPITCVPAAERERSTMHGLVTIEGEALLLASTLQGPKLYSLDGQARYGTSYVTSPMCAGGKLVFGAFAAVGNDRIVFASHGASADSKSSTQDFLLLIWNLLTGKLVEHRVAYASLFKRNGTSFEPLQAGR